MRLSSLRASARKIRTADCRWRDAGSDQPAAGSVPLTLKAGSRKRAAISCQLAVLPHPNRPISEVRPPRVRPDPDRVYALRGPLNIAQLVYPHRRRIVHQNLVGTMVKLDAPRRVHFPCRAVDHGIERRIAIGRLVVSTLLRLGACPL